MKDITITAARQKTELKWIAGCFVAAILLNVAAIIAYKTPWSELFSQILWVLVITIILYALSAAIRIIISLLLSIKKPTPS
ncbi:MAG: hypothetical protein LBR18_06660 [Tannerella sp.]|jgi:hypothetical protein|nr:hypothetical protein [Tannerella sp.]